VRCGFTIVALIAACAGTPRVVEAPATVTVLEAGAEPRQRVRYELAAHVPERRELTIKSRLSLKFVNTVLENGQRDVDAPTMTVVDRLEVTGFTPTGDALVAGEVVDASVGDDVVDPAIRSRAVASIAALKGRREVWRMAPSGATFDRTVSRSDIAAFDRVASLFDQDVQATAVFPTWRSVPARAGRPARGRRSAT
jgi:hypothetical protein